MRQRGFLESRLRWLVASKNFPSRLCLILTAQKRNVFDASKEERMAQARRPRMLVDGGMHARTEGLFTLYSSDSNLSIMTRAK